MTIGYKFRESARTIIRIFKNANTSVADDIVAVMDAYDEYEHSEKGQKELELYRKRYGGTSEELKNR